MRKVTKKKKKKKQKHILVISVKTPEIFWKQSTHEDKGDI